MEDNSVTKLTRLWFMITGASTAAAVTLPLQVGAQPAAAGQSPVVAVSFQVNGTITLEKHLAKLPVLV